jgi:hypothetical protein
LTTTLRCLQLGAAQHTATRVCPRQYVHAGLRLTRSLMPVNKGAINGGTACTTKTTRLPRVSAAMLHCLGGATSGCARQRQESSSHRCHTHVFPAHARTRRLLQPNNAHPSGGGARRSSSVETPSLPQPPSSSTPDNTLARHTPARWLGRRISNPELSGKQVTTAMTTM